MRVSLFAKLVLFFATVAIELVLIIPSFPAILKTFNTSESMIQHILTFNFIGTALSVLFMGPLSDSFGRKSIMLYSSAIFLLGTILCAFAPSMTFMLLGRFIQGVGAGAATSAAYNVFSDLLSPEECGKKIGQLRGIMLILMGTAPLIGALMTTSFGWRSAYYPLLTVSALSFLSTFLIPESLPAANRNPFKLKETFKPYLMILRDKRSRSYILIQGLSLAGISLWNSIASLLFIRHFNISINLFGVFEAMVLVTGITANFLIGTIIKRKGMRPVLQSGIVLSLLATGLVLLNALFFPLNSYVIIAILALFNFGSVLVFATSLAQILYFHPGHQGAASALTAKLRYLISAVLIAITSSLSSISFLSFAIPFFLIAATAALIWHKLYPFYLFKKEPSPEIEEQNVSE